MLLDKPNNVARPLNQIPEDFSFDTGKVKTDESAIALVVQDTQCAEKFIMSRLWMSEWRIAKSLYEAPIKQEYWRDTLVPRASNSYPLVSQHVRAILAHVMPSLFPEWPPFVIDPSEGTPRQVARGWETILSYQLRQADVKSQIRLIAKDAEIFGTGIGKWGWETFTQKRQVYVRSQKPNRIPSPVPGGNDIIIDTDESDDLNVVEFEERISRPFFRRCEINHVLVSPGLREPNIQRAAWVVYRDYLTIRDINKLRDFEGYNIPSEEELIALAVPPAETADSSSVETESTSFPAQGHRPLPRYIDETENPLDHKLEVLERVSPESVIVVLQRKKVIRNEDNPFGQINFVSCFWDDIPGTFYAFGIPRRIGSTQTHIQGLRNMRLDDINLNLQNVWLEKQGTNLTGQPMKFYPGARIKVTDPAGIMPMIKQPVLAESYREDQVMVSEAEKTTGANELLVQGAMPVQGRSSMGRTAGGAAQIGGAASSRIQDFVDIVADQVLIPVLYAFLHMNRLLLPPKTMRRIIGKTLWDAMEAEHGDGDLLCDMCNSSSDVQFLMQAGSNMAAKKNMASMLPFEMQMYMSPGVQSGLSEANLKINWLELTRRIGQASGWRSQDDVIIPMTPEDVQRREASDPEIIKAKATQDRIRQLGEQDKELSAQQHDQKISEVDAKGLATAGVDVLKNTIERAAQDEEIEGVR